MERLGERIRHADAAVARDAFRGLFKRVTLLWRPKEGGRYSLARVTIQAKAGFDLTAGNRSVTSGLAKCWTIDFSQENPSGKLSIAV